MQKTTQETTPNAESGTPRAPLRAFGVETLAASAVPAVVGLAVLAYALI